MEIRDFEKEYAREMSKIIWSNLYELNIKDYGKAVIDKIAVRFTEDAICAHFPQRTKCFVAVDEGEVVGTASIDRL